MRLQEHDFRSSQYERPGGRWVCGRAASGHPCSLGPDAGGRCEAEAECVPHKRGDRWLCSRAQSCAEGPLPDGSCSHPVARCQPQRSLRAKRGRVSQWMVLLTLGALLALLTGPRLSAWISPGTLQHAHGALENRCQACHSAFQGGPARWIQAAFAPPSAVDASDRCGVCHLAGAHPLQAHGLAPATLRGLAHAAWARPAEAAPPTGFELHDELLGGYAVGEAISCGTCHKEHRGAGAALTALDRLRCQSCHARRFQGLAVGHPQFSSFPHQGRTALVFDHVSHLRKHFQEQTVAAAAPKACTDCHRLDSAGRYLPVIGFEEACGACHAAQIRGEGQTGALGIAVLTVPGLDVEALAQHGIDIGQWPQDTEAPLTPFMGLLLGTDPSLADDITHVRGLDLLDLRAADAGTLAAVQRIAWAVKGFYAELLTQGQAALGERLGRALGTQSGAAEQPGLLAGLPPALLRAAQSAWFPDLLAAVARHRAGLPPIAAPPPEAGPDGAAEQAPEAAADGGVAPSGDDALLGGEPPAEDALLDAKDSEQDGPRGSDQGSDILGGDASADLGGDLGGDSLLGGAPEDAGSLAPAPAESAAPAVPEPVSSEDWVADGGWYRRGGTLYYRPGGHADPFMKTWLDLGARLPGAAAVFDQLAQPKGPGLCVYCHSVAGTGEARRVRWRGRQPQPSGATVFAHGPHLSQAGKAGCGSCHRLDPAADYLRDYEEPGAPAASNFHQLSKTACVDCHNPRQAGDDCQLCHRYHVAGVVTPVLATGW